jgi:hypothetical protein
MDHTGQGPAEITAAHVEEAKWVLVRRLRRKAVSTARVAVLRVTQLVLTLLVGVGASNVKELWGALMSLLAVVGAAIVWVVEREYTREV